MSEKEIDKINIHNASLLAMRKAVENLLERVACESDYAMGVIPDSTKRSEEKSGIYISRSRIGARDGTENTFLDSRLRENDTENFFVVLDGKFLIPEFHLKQQAVVDGDAKIFSIAAASIVAKVYRDQLMKKLHTQYPHYNFAKHKGYATLHHRQAIKKFGLSPLHRLSFCRNYL